MKTYVQGGFTSLDDIRNHFNTFAQGGPKKTYSQWKEEMGQKYPWLELNSQKAGYDYERYFNENYDDAVSRLTESEARHFTDKYKLPNHPTFSNESIYSRGPNYGGTWDQNDKFTPSIINQQQYPNIYKEYRPYSEEEIYGKKYAAGGLLDGPDDPPENDIPAALPEVKITAPRSYARKSPYKEYLNDPKALKKDFLRGIRDYYGIFSLENLGARLYNWFDNNYYSDPQVKDELAKMQEASGFFNEYLNSPVYKEKYEKANLTPEQMEYSVAPKLRVIADNGGRGAYNDFGRKRITVPIFEGIDDFWNNDATIVHEMAHDNPLFNDYTTTAKSKESPYYGHDYSAVPSRWKELLTPTNTSYATFYGDRIDLDEHDTELTENYSDLQAVRYLLYKNGIWNPLNPEKAFGEKEYNKLMRLIPIEQDAILERFMKYHSPQQVIDAINEIAQTEDNREILPIT